MGLGCAKTPQRALRMECDSSNAAIEVENDPEHARAWGRRKNFIYQISDVICFHTARVMNVGFRRRLGVQLCMQCPVTAHLLHAAHAQTHCNTGAGAARTPAERRCRSGKWRRCHGRVDFGESQRTYPRPKVLTASSACSRHLIAETNSRSAPSSHLDKAASDRDSSSLF